MIKKKFMKGMKNFLRKTEYSKKPAYILLGINGLIGMSNKSMREKFRRIKKL